MALSMSLLLLVTVPIGEKEAPKHFDNYTRAYRVAQETSQPMLVILNPGEDSDLKPIPLEDVQRTSNRRKLLEDYVVVVLDTSTEHGGVCHKLFGSGSLPRVVVIDKRQKRQIFRTSEPLYGQLWNTILTTYRTGENPIPVFTRQQRPAYYLQQQASHCST